MHELVDFFRRNPQAFALLLICLILGIGTFIAVLISLGASGNTSGPGYPNGSIMLFRALAAALPGGLT
jgi:hypothetical protein